MNHHDLEEGDVLKLDFSKLKKVVDCGEDIIPAIAQDHETGEVLIVGYVNELALRTAKIEGMATFWSTSRNELWIKGKTSGDFLKSLKFGLTASRTQSFTRSNPEEKGLVIPKMQMGCPDRVATIENSIRKDLSSLINELNQKSS